MENFSWILFWTVAILAFAPLFIRPIALTRALARIDEGMREVEMEINALGLGHDAGVMQAYRLMGDVAAAYPWIASGRFEYRFRASADGIAELLRAIDEHPWLVGRLVLVACDVQMLLWLGKPYKVGMLRLVALGRLIWFLYGRRRIVAGSPSADQAEALRVASSGPNRLQTA